MPPIALYLVLSLRVSSCPPRFGVGGGGSVRVIDESFKVMGSAGQAGRQVVSYNAPLPIYSAALLTARR